MLRCGDLLQLFGDLIEGGKRRKSELFRERVSNKIRLALLTCFYGQSMVMCYMFLGDPPDTAEEDVTALNIVDFMEKLCRL